MQGTPFVRHGLLELLGRGAAGDQKLDQPGQPPGALPRESYASWIRRVGAATIDVIPFMLFVGFNFVYLMVFGVTCHANGYAFCGPPLKDTSLGLLAGLGLLLLTFGSKPVLLLVLLLHFALGTMAVLQSAVGSRLLPLLLAAQQIPPLLLGTEVVLLLVYAIWNWGYRQGTTGSTIGKSVLQLTVVSEGTGKPIGFGRSIVRELAHVVDWVFCYIGYLFPLWDAKRRTLADMIMSTVCLTTPKPQGQGDEVRRKVKVGLIPVVVVVTLAAAGITGYLSPPVSWDVRLPFTGLKWPSGVAVDAAGDLYVTDAGNNRVVRLAAGSSTQTVLRFTDLNDPGGVAVDAAGAVYVADSYNHRVVKLAPGSSNQVVLPFNGISPAGVAVDAAGNIYVSDAGNNRVLVLVAGSSTQSDLPFTGLNHPEGLAVDAEGAVYVADNHNSRIVKLAAGSPSLPHQPYPRRQLWYDTQTVLPFRGFISSPNGVAVDPAGAVYVTNRSGNCVLKLAADSLTPTAVVFPTPHANGVAVDTAGTAYVIDYSGNQVIKMARIAFQEPGDVLGRLWPDGAASERTC